MKRACGTVFLLSALFFFPFPNPLLAPGYDHLPKLRVPTAREILSELPPPWNERTLDVVDQTRKFYFDCTETFQFFSDSSRNFVAGLFVKLVG